MLAGQMQSTRSPSPKKCSRRTESRKVGLALASELAAGKPSILGKTVTILLSCLAIVSAARAQSEITLQIRDYLTMPDPGKRDSESQNFSAYSRANMLREEPGSDRGRLFLSDLDGPLYIVDKKTKKLTTFLDFNGK